MTKISSTQVDDSNFTLQLNRKLLNKIDATIALSPICVQLCREARAQQGGREKLYNMVSYSRFCVSVQSRTASIFIVSLCISPQVHVDEAYAAAYRKDLDDKCGIDTSLRACHWCKKSAKDLNMEVLLKCAQCP